MKKLGSQLRTGDIITRMPGNEHGPGLAVRLLFVSELSVKTTEREVGVIDQQKFPRQRIDIRYFRPDETYEVEAPEPAVTPDELRDLVTAARMVVGSDMPHPGRLVELVDRLDPPAPPTLQEALEALAKAEPKLSAHAAPEDRRIAPLFDILDRARRTGLLPKGDAS